jgi:prepilin-type processing-associated H-X9-DG protein
VVIGIIAVLIAILLPSLNKARQAAMKTQCLSNLRQFALADQMYMNESKGWHVPAWQAFPGQPNAALTNCWSGNALFRRCLNVRIVNPNETAAANSGVTQPRLAQEFLPRNYYCPMAVRNVSGGANSYIDSNNQELVSPNGSMGMNVEGVDGGANTNRVPKIDPQLPQAQDPPAWQGFHGYKASQVRHADQKLEFVDSLTKLVNMYGSGDPTGSKTHPGTNAALWARDYDNVHEAGSGGAVTRVTAWRHQGYANVAFFDGHADSLRADAIKQNANLWDPVR